MKALIGLAGVAIAVLTAGGIKAALPGAPTGPDPSAGQATQVRVTAVVDGDTLRVEDLGGRELGRVRLLGIDAPEVAHPPAPEECYADQATDLLEELASVIDATDAVALTAAPQPLARRAVRRWIAAGTFCGYAPDSSAVERVLDVAAGRAQACELPGGARVSRHRQRLTLSPPAASTSR